MRVDISWEDPILVNADRPAATHFGHPQVPASEDAVGFAGDKP
jgi:hypothetical protein